MSAGLTARRVEDTKLLFFALYRDIPDDPGSETANKVIEGVDVVDYLRSVYSTASGKAVLTPISYASSVQTIKRLAEDLRQKAVIWGKGTSTPQVVTRTTILSKIAETHLSRLTSDEQWIH